MCFGGGVVVVGCVGWCVVVGGWGGGGGGCWIRDLKCWGNTAIVGAHPTGWVQEKNLL